MSDLTGLPLPSAIAACVARMQSPWPSEMLAAVVALRRLLALHDKDCKDLASWIMAQVNREEELLTAARERVFELYDSAWDAEMQGRLPEDKNNAAA